MPIIIENQNGKINLAEVKLNGLRGNERQHTDTVGGNQATNIGLEEQFNEYQLADDFSDFQRTKDASERAERARQEQLERERQDAERKRREHLQQLEEERRRVDEKNRERNKRNERNNGEGYGISM